MSFSFSVSAETPGSENKNIEDERFSEQRALQALAVIKESLQSFKLIVVKSENEEPIILKNFQHTDWEMQNIGIPNSLMTIEGVIRKQKYMISKLEYELESMKNSASKKRSEELEKQLHIDQDNYNKYLDSIILAD
ncbi:hypothetical protein MNBD_GAMMA10-3321 [hydrothermal vent metagenome]|uniref:Uncharacterized protein n=1 Tax=hydrothermal vent metagenome TaxID=652676 RepID=A0A3B0Y4P1_9ZZZZ